MFTSPHPSRRELEPPEGTDAALDMERPARVFF